MNARERPSRELSPLGLTVFVACLLLAAALASCGRVSVPLDSTVESGAQETHFSTLQPPPTSTHTPTPTPSPTPAPVRPRYGFRVELDYWAHRLDVQQYVEYTNSTGQALEELVFNLPFNHHQGVFSLLAVDVLVGSDHIGASYRLEDTSLRVALPQSLPANQRTTVFLEYRLSPRPMILDSMFSGGSPGWSEDAINLGNWYPVLAPYASGEGWFTFPYHQVGDLYVAEVADYEAEIGAPEGIILVGPGEAVREGQVWRFRLPAARSFAFCASHRYECATSESGGIAFSSCYFPEHEAAGRMVLDVTVDAVELFEELFGPYPYETFAIGETSFTGGAEFSGLVIYGSRMYQTYVYGPQGQGVRTALYTLVPHETSHQWWYGVVGNNQVLEPWLDEALAKYCEQLFYERLHPEHAQWRWEWMGNTTREPGPIDLPIYDFSKERQYEADIYLRGALFLDELRQLVGDESFFAFLRDYYETEAYELSTTDDFFAVLGVHTAEDLSPLLKAYFSE
jgi:hypothetical protein